ncbi:MAG: hemin uptake protein HemP [Alphaproteobacteria bacterium]|nr:hemin uptake protein HemP [Alphaproteobacteria bacterium]
MTRETLQATRPSAPQALAPSRLTVRDLMKGAREVLLEHNQQDYRLRITSKGRLILTK